MIYDCYSEEAQKHIDKTMAWFNKTFADEINAAIKKSEIKNFSVSSKIGIKHDKE